MIPNWLEQMGPKVDRDALLTLRNELSNRLHEERWQPWRRAAEEVAGISTKYFELSEGWVRIGTKDELTPAAGERLETALKAFRPWKKGPYEIFGHRIDSEWRSQMKWERIARHIGNLEGQSVADIGCHNGYFMYFMRALGAAHVLGFEPMPINVFNHRLLQSLHQVPEISLEMFGVEHIDLFPGSFDTIFCMGILYHHTDPVGLLRKMRSALKPRGRIVIDCQGIAGDQPLSLTPNGRYAGAAGVWFLPTLSCLQNWVRRAGFTNQNVVYSERLETDEQRATPWADVKSLEDFLDPDDRQMTIEGHPAPWRHYLIATL